VRAGCRLTFFVLSRADCPFTGNCVGLTTFRSFYLWVCYGFIGISYACFISFLPFKYCWYDGLFTSKHGDVTTLKAAWTAEHGELCARLGRGSYLFLPAFFGWLSTAFIFVFQSALIRADMTTIEYLKGLTQFKLRLRAPENVAQDAATRDKGRKRRNAAQEQEMEHDEMHEHDADLMESGSPVAGSIAPSAASTVAGPSFAYNPHKGFRLLVFQDQPLWTLFVPPVLLRLRKTVPRATSDRIKLRD
jgi:hypothetical protein